MPDADPIQFPTRSSAFTMPRLSSEAKALLRTALSSTTRNVKPGRDREWVELSNAGLIDVTGRLTTEGSLAVDDPSVTKLRICRACAGPIARGRGARDGNCTTCTEESDRIAAAASNAGEPAETE